MRGSGKKRAGGLPYGRTGAKDPAECPERRHSILGQIAADRLRDRIPGSLCQNGGYPDPQGILTVLEQPVYDLTQLLEQPDPLFLMLENLQDPGNLGTMIRTGEGAGITGVIMNNQTVDIFNPKTIRATMGSIFRVPFVYVPDLALVLEQMHAKVSTPMRHT